MRIIANNKKWIIAFLLIASLIIGLAQTKPVKVQIQMLSHEISKAVTKAQEKLVYFATPTKKSIESIDPKTVKQQIASMTTGELNDRKNAIDEEIRSGSLVDQFNAHALSEDGIFRLRKLAFERSLITLKQIEQTN